MEARFLQEYVEKLRSCGDSRERRAVLHKLEPLLEGWAQVEKEVLFPILQRFLGFGEWIQEARAHQSSFRELIQYAHLTHDHERILDITDELGARLHQYIEGIRNVLVPRLIQTLKRPELEDLQSRMGRYWAVIAVPADDEQAA